MIRIPDRIIIKFGYRLIPFGSDVYNKTKNQEIVWWKKKLYRIWSGLSKFCLRNPNECTFYLTHLTMVQCYLLNIRNDSCDMKYPLADANSKNCTSSNFYFHDNVHFKNVCFQSTRRQAWINFTFHKSKSFWFIWSQGFTDNDHGFIDKVGRSCVRISLYQPFRTMIYIIR